MPRDFRAILEWLNDERPEGRLGASVTMLDMSSGAREQLVGYVSHAESKTPGDGSLHDATMLFDKPSFALTFITVPKADADDLDRVLGAYCKRKKSEMGIKSWMTLGSVVDDARDVRVMRQLCG